jgi:hypothetical protein
MTAHYTGSRWEFLKNRSQWHFDPFRAAESGTDSYTSVGRFRGDLESIVQRFWHDAEPVTWKSGVRTQYPDNDPLRNALAEQQDFDAAGFDSDQVMFDRAFVHDDPVVSKILDCIGMDNCDVRFNLQLTGQILVTHMDYLDGFQHGDWPGRRFAVMLEDWKWGQIFQLGNANWTQWHAGDCITWEYRDIPHSTANMGWWPRPMLQISGTMTAKTELFLQNSSADRQLQLT